MKILEYKKEIIIFICGLLLGIVFMWILWPSRITKLKDGNEVVASVKGKEFTSNDLYQLLKNENGIEKLVEEIDSYLLHQKYKNIDKEAREYALENKDNVYESYQTYYGMSKEEFLLENNFSTEEDFINHLSNEYYFQKYYDDYVKDSIKENDIKKYYDENVFGEKNIYLFASSKGSDDLSKIRDYLNKGKSFEEIKKKFKNVEAYNFENVKFTDTDQFGSLLNNIASLKKKKASDIITDSKYGYVVIYVVSENKKITLDNAKADIRSILAEKVKQEDANIYYRAFEELRKKYDLKIYDTELKKIYDNSLLSIR